MFFALVIGSVLMIAGGVAEMLCGEKAERKRLETIAKPLTAIETKVRSAATRFGTATAATAPRAAASEPGVT